MKKVLNIFQCLAFWFVFSNVVFAQEKATLSGYVYDADNGESLIGAAIYITSVEPQGVLTNAYGFYSLSLPIGEYQIICSYLGFDDQVLTIDLTSNVKKEFYLSAGLTLQTIEVSSEEEDKNVSSTDMGTVKLPIEQIKNLPVLFGEVDILKTIQLLPGVSSAGEGSSGFNVRGGSLDQNLVLLDEAIVYNSGHLFGFFSVFNADALKNTTLYKGGMPAQYGGRISSVLDVQMRDGNDKYYNVEGGIGLISSRLTIDGPIVKDKSSFIISGRRTYIFDLASSALKSTDFAGTNYYFYDFNSKFNYKFSEKDRLYLSGYFGRDVLKFNIEDRDFSIDLPYGNSTATLRWNHVFSDKLFANTSLIYNDYDFTFNGKQDDFNFKLFSGIRDWNGKFDLDYFASTTHTFKTGLNYTYHKLTPSSVTASDGENEFTTELLPKYGHEMAAYISDVYKPSSRLELSLGLRYSMFIQTGPYDSPVDNKLYKEGEKVKTYAGLEPRFSMRYSLNDVSSLKAGYNYNYQYVHLVSNSTSSLPADVWVPSTQLIKPQKGSQYSVGYFRNFKENKYEASVEFYYREMKNQLDYRDDYVDNASQDVELDFVSGNGEAYGMELFIKKSKGAVTGWLGYTLSRTVRWFDGIENGRKYPTGFDRTHDISLLGSYKVNKKINVSAVFVYGTGRPFTPIKGIYFIEQSPRIAYGARNSTRLEDYHRIDLALNYTPKPNSERNFVSSWNFSVYNVYNRKNTLFLDTDFESDDMGSSSVIATKFSIFPIIPSVTWNFKWNNKKQK